MSAATAAMSVLARLKNLASDPLRGHTDTVILSQLMRDENYGCEVDQYFQPHSASGRLLRSDPFADLLQLSFTMY